MRYIYYLLLALMSGCVSKQNSFSSVIPVGVYEPAMPDSTEYLKVENDMIFFHVLGNDGKYIDRKYCYVVWPDQTVMPKILASLDYYSGVGIYDWKLTEKGILRTNIKTKKQTMFIMQYDDEIK